MAVLTIPQMRAKNLPAAYLKKPGRPEVYKYCAPDRACEGEFLQYAVMYCIQAAKQTCNKPMQINVA